MRILQFLSLFLQVELGDRWQFMRLGVFREGQLRPHDGRQCGPAKLRPACHAAVGEAAHHQAASAPDVARQENEARPVLSAPALRTGCQAGTSITHSVALSRHYFFMSSSLNLATVFFSQMFEWIYHNRDLFLASYVEIGNSFDSAKTLQEDHNRFTMASMVSFSFAQNLV